MKVLLINLPKEGEIRDFSTPDYLINDFMKYPPLGLLCIASGISRRHSVTIRDACVANMSVQSVIDEVAAARPDILGVSAVTRRLYPFQEIIKGVKNKCPVTRIVAGGPHVNIFPSETMRLGYVDYALPGYGEERFPLLVDAIADGERIDRIKKIPGLYYKRGGAVESTGFVPNPVNLDRFAFPDRKLVDLRNYYTIADNEATTTMFSSRGCPFSCIFCDVQDKNYHFKSPVLIADEIEEIMRMGVRKVHFFDDNFNLDRERVFSICNEIIRRKLRIKWTARVRALPFDMEMARVMKESGCSRLHVGIESVAPEILKLIRKGISFSDIVSFFRVTRNAGIETLAFFMVGFPSETRQYRESLLKIIKNKLDPTYIYVNIVAPLPNTELYRKLLDDGVIKDDFWRRFASCPQKDFQLPFCGSDAELRDLKKTVYEYHRKFFFSPRFVGRELLRSLSSPKALGKKVIAAFNFMRVNKREL